MDTPPIPNSVCKLQETNETKIEATYNVVCQKLILVQGESTALKQKVRNLVYESALCEKEELCLDYENKILEEEIAKLKSQAEEAACSAELLKWKRYKLGLIKEFDQKSNELTYKTIQEKKESLNKNPTELMETDGNLSDEKENKLSITKAKEKTAELKEEIEKMKRNIQMTDPKLLTNIKLLEKRNAALLLRYQRQLGEAKARLRQTLAEKKSLERILAEKNSLLKDT